MMAVTAAISDRLAGFAGAWAESLPEGHPRDACKPGTATVTVIMPPCGHSALPAPSVPCKPLAVPLPAPFPRQAPPRT